MLQFTRFLYLLFFAYLTHESINRQLYAQGHLLNEIRTQKKTLQAGLGIIGIRTNHYRGSNQSKNFYFPFPGITYQSERLRIENSFMEGRYKINDFSEINLSLSGSLPVATKDNEARQGMPNLPLALEAGPMLKVKIWNSSDLKNWFSFHFPARIQLVTDGLKLHHRGEFYVPYLSLTHLFLEDNQLLLNYTFALMYASRSYHNHFYKVDPLYAKPNRPEYSPSGGYSGAHATVYLSYRKEKWLAFNFIRFDDLHGTHFEDSPLVKQKYFLSYGLGFVYYFYSSAL